MRGPSLSSCLALPFTALSRARSTSLLPLLYHTRTLLSEPKIARPFPTADSYVTNYDGRRRNFCSTTQRQASAEEAQRLKDDPIHSVDGYQKPSSEGLSQTKPSKKKKPPSKRSSPIKPFMKKAHSERSSPSEPFMKNSHSERSSPSEPFMKKAHSERSSPSEPPIKKKLFQPSTVTAGEQAVFDKLLKEVSKSPTLEEDGEDILEQDEPISGYDPNIDLDRIFEDAIKQVRLNEERSKATVARNLLYPVWNEKAIDTGVSDGEQALGPIIFKQPVSSGGGVSSGDEAQAERLRLEMACDEHRTLVLGKLDSANSDKEIWQVLEDHVFDLVTLLSKETVEKEGLTDKAKTRRHEIRKRIAEINDMADDTADDTADDSVEEGEPNPLEDVTVNMAKTKAIPVNKILLILYRNYAEYCLHALRLFRKRHPTSMYAPLVISTIRARGPISYVLGVDIDIYNEFLFLQWSQYSDLHGMADTIEEMLNQGIEGNDVTVALIQGIAGQRRRATRAWSGPVMKEWWSMRGNVEGWRRVDACYHTIEARLTKKARAQSLEAEGEDGEPDTDREASGVQLWRAS